MPHISCNDGAQIFYTDLGAKDGQPVLFHHGWPLTGDDWERQMLFLGERGYRVLAHDRRGHGRSAQTWYGNNMDQYADDVAALVAALDLKNLVMIGHSTGGGEVARYLGRHGTGRVTKAVLLGAVPPLMLKTGGNPGGLPIGVFDVMRAGVRADRSQFYYDLTTPFYGFNRPGVRISEGLRESFRLQGMMGGLKGQLDCIREFSEVDYTEDLRKIDIPVLVAHGDDDQIVPIGASALMSARILQKPTLKIYPKGCHGFAATNTGELNADLFAFITGEKVDGAD
jgi:non-heme chloroperoxidase